MSATRMKVRADLRRRWRAAAIIVLLAAIGGGAAMAAIAGARRTDSAYPRFLRDHHGAQAVVATFKGSPPFTVKDVLALPNVVAVQPRHFFLLLNGDPEACDQTCIVASAAGPSIGGPVDEQKLLSGRLADPTKPEEVVLTVVGRDSVPLRVGSSFPLKGVPFEPEIFKDFADAAARDPLTMKVVGVVATPGDLPPQLGDETVDAILTPAFFDRYPVPGFGVGDAYAVRLRPGASVTDFRTAALASRGGELLAIDRTLQDANVQRSMHLQAQALWLLGIFLALVVFVVLAQAIARDLFLGADDVDALASLGFSRAQRWAAAVVRSAIIAVSGGSLAVLVAVAMSGLAPVGLARDAEPAPGLAIDPVATVGGFMVLVLGVLLVAAPLAWRYARTSTGTRDVIARPSVMVGLAARLGFPSAGVAGVRFALERGRGMTAVPIRSTVGGLVAGVAALVAAFTFSSSLDHLLATPRLYGVPWDLVVGHDFGDFRSVATDVARVPGVRGLSLGTDNLGFLVGEQELSGIGLDVVEGSVTPPLLSGRAPDPGTLTRGEPVEMVLGQKTLQRLNVAVGDHFAFTIPGGPDRAIDAVVVGSGVIPTAEDSAPLGDAAWFSTMDLFRAVGIPEDPTEALAGGDDQAPLVDRAYIALEPGADEKTVFDAVEAALGAQPNQLWQPPVGTPTDLVSFGRVRNLPAAVGLGLGLLAIAILVNTLLTSIRRRRRDIAIFKSLGFSRRLVRVAVSVQATVLATVTCLFGLPLGLVVGRWLWTAYADSQGFIAESVAPMVVMVAMVPIALVAANLVALLPGRAAASTQPALALRAE